jgi:hypothetical protein
MTDGDAVVLDLSCIGTDGKALSNEAWMIGWNRSLAVMLNGCHRDHLIGTVNIDGPSATTELGEKVILYGRSMMAFTSHQGPQTC